MQVKDILIVRNKHKKHKEIYLALVRTTTDFVKRVFFGDDKIKAKKTKKKLKPKGKIFDLVQSREFYEYHLLNGSVDLSKAVKVLNREMDFSMILNLS